MKYQISKKRFPSARSDAFRVRMSWCFHEWCYLSSSHLTRNSSKSLPHTSKESFFKNQANPCRNLQFNKQSLTPLLFSSGSQPQCIVGLSSAADFSGEGSGAHPCPLTHSCLLCRCFPYLLCSWDTRGKIQVCRI